MFALIKIQTAFRPFGLNALSAAVLIAFSASVLAADQAALDAYGLGQQSMLALLSFLLAVISVVGYLIYRVIRSQLKADILTDVREHQVGSLISLAHHNYQAYMISDDLAVKQSSINTSIVHTDLALRIAKEELDVSNKAQIPLIALGATNLAYYFIEMSDLFCNTGDMVRCEAYKLKAQDTLAEWTVEICAYLRLQPDKKPYWYEILDSKLYAEFKSSNDDAFRGQILRTVEHQLLENPLVPTSAKGEFKRIWVQIKA